MRVLLAEFAGDKVDLYSCKLSSLGVTRAGIFYGPTAFTHSDFPARFERMNIAQPQSHGANDELLGGFLYCRKVAFGEWKTVIAVMLLIAAIPAFFVVTTSPEFEATAKIQVARAVASDVETPRMAIERIGNPVFVTSNVRTACATTDGKLNRIWTAVVPAVSLVEIRYRAASATQAADCVNAIFEKLRLDENLRVEELLKSPVERLARYKEAFAATSKVQRNIDSNVMDFNSVASRFSQPTLLFSAYLQGRAESEALRRDISVLEGLMNAPYTSQTSLFQPIYAPNTPVNDNKIAKLLVLIFTGLISGFAFVVAKDRCRTLWWQLRTSRNASI